MNYKLIFKEKYLLEKKQKNKQTKRKVFVAKLIVFSTCVFTLNK